MPLIGEPGLLGRFKNKFGKIFQPHSKPRTSIKIETASRGGFFCVLESIFLTKTEFDGKIKLKIEV